MRSSRSLCLLAAATSLAACAESTTPGASVPLSLSFSSAPGTGATLSRAPGSASFDVSATQGANTLVISKAQLVVARLELQQSGASCAGTADAGDTDGEHSNSDADCEELELAPSVIDLPVTDAIVSKLAIMIPAGTYSALEAKIRPIRGDGEHGRGSTAFLTANPSFANVSVRVEGTYNTKPFVYTGSPRLELETTFSPALVADASPVNLTMSVDLSSWFRAKDLTLIDPATANAGGANAELVASNIRRSFRAFRDDDRNGHDDQDEKRRP